MIPTVSIQGRSEMQSATYLCANGFFKATESVSDENTCLRHMLVGMPQNKVKVQAYGKCRELWRARLRCPTRRAQQAARRCLRCLPRLSRLGRIPQTLRYSQRACKAAQVERGTRSSHAFHAMECCDGVCRPSVRWADGAMPCSLSFGQCTCPTRHAWFVLNLSTAEGHAVKRLFQSN